MLHLIFQLNDWLLEASPCLMLILFICCHTTLYNNTEEVASVIIYCERLKPVSLYFCMYNVKVLKINNAC
jgi:hypothetical protein